MLVRQPCCAKALWLDSYLFYKRWHLNLNFSSSSWRFLMTISRRLMILFLSALTVNYIDLHVFDLIFVIHDWLLLFPSSVPTILTNHIKSLQTTQCIVLKKNYITFKQVWELYIVARIVRFYIYFYIILSHCLLDWLI